MSLTGASCYSGVTCETELEQREVEVTTGQEGVSRSKFTGNVSALNDEREKYKQQTEIHKTTCMQNMQIYVCNYVSMFVSTPIFSLESTQSVMPLAPGVAQQGFSKTNKLLTMILELRNGVKWDQKLRRRE